MVVFSPLSDLAVAGSTTERRKEIAMNVSAIRTPQIRDASDLTFSTALLEQVREFESRVRHELNESVGATTIS